MELLRGSLLRLPAIKAPGRHAELKAQTLDKRQPVASSRSMSHLSGTGIGLFGVWIGEPDRYGTFTASSGRTRSTWTRTVASREMRSARLRPYPHRRCGWSVPHGQAHTMPITAITATPAVVKVNNVFAMIGFFGRNQPRGSRPKLGRRSAKRPQSVQAVSPSREGSRRNGPDPVHVGDRPGLNR